MSLSKIMEIVFIDFLHVQKMFISCLYRYFACLGLNSLVQTFLRTSQATFSFSLTITVSNYNTKFNFFAFIDNLNFTCLLKQMSLFLEFIHFTGLRLNQLLSQDMFPVKHVNFSQGHVNFSQDMFHPFIL